MQLGQVLNGVRGRARFQRSLKPKAPSDQQQHSQDKTSRTHDGPQHTGLVTWFHSTSGFELFYHANFSYEAGAVVVLGAPIGRC